MLKARFKKGNDLHCDIILTIYEHKMYMVCTPKTIHHLCGDAQFTHALENQKIIHHEKVASSDREAEGVST